jgi:hypothetical protein
MVPASATSDKQDLTARMLVPVVTAARLEGHVADRAVKFGSRWYKHLQYAVPIKLLLN